MTPHALWNVDTDGRQQFVTAPCHQALEPQERDLHFCVQIHPEVSSLDCPCFRIAQVWKVLYEPCWLLI